MLTSSPWNLCAVAQMTRRSLAGFDRRVPRGADRAMEAHEAFGHDGIREAYGELGAVGFYTAKGAQYVNPHDLTLREALVNALNLWRDEGLLGDNSGAFHRVLDVACGSGEASLSFEAWAEQTGEIERGNPL